MKLKRAHPFNLPIPMRHSLPVLLFATTLLAYPAAAQSLGAGGVIEGTVLDPSNAAIRRAVVAIRNPISAYERKTHTDSAGEFHFANIPPNRYHLTVTAPGFSTAVRHISVRTMAPIRLKIVLELSKEQTSVTVEASGADLVENVPYAHADVGRHLISKLPTASPGSGMSDAVTLTAPGVVADANGFFHPLGAHAGTSFVVDGEPITDQQSKAFSTQIPMDAIQSMEVITGMPNAEYGDKTSLVVNAVTRSALGQSQPSGSFDADYGSFGTIGEETTLGFGSPRFGNFLAANAQRSGRFLDTPEFRPRHAIGNNWTIFDRLDSQPNGKDLFHLNLFGARNWFQIPNSLDQPRQDQRQQVKSFNIAPGYQHIFSASTLLSVNPFVRQDRVQYYPSRNQFDDQPGTVAQQRRLTNYGVRAEIGYVHGAHSLKAGVQLMQTRLRENFDFGITDPGFNAVCLDRNGNPLHLPGVTSPAECTNLGFAPNRDLVAGLVPFDLTRGGSLLQFRDTGNINEYGAYIQDSITLGGLVVNGGLRLDRYDGLSKATGVQPRVGLSYLVKATNTVLRASYARTFETPYNENLLLSSATGRGGLVGSEFGAYGVKPLQPGRRNQFNVGFQQSLDGILQVDAGYFWKFTDNAYDFGVLFNTPITFPISWRKSKLDGVAVRLSTPNLRGFVAYTTMGHTRARFFGPENGGLVFNSPLDTGVFRIDHDQAFEQTTHLYYQRPNHGPWISLTWRYDSGAVAGAVESVDDALVLTGAQQAAIGFHCGGAFATPGNPITACPAGGGATRLRIPAPGTANADHNPPRIAPRHILDFGVGTDNLFRSDRRRVTLRFTVTNLANTVALYNFLSTFGGTHFVAPRSYVGRLGFVF